MKTMLAPRFWAGHIVMLLALAAAAGLGLWQLHAWQGHRAADAVDLTVAKPVALSSVMGGDSSFPGKDLGRPVTFAGQWLSRGTVYVSGRTHDGHSGYWVVSPLMVDGTRSAMPVVRGWSARPSAPAPSGTAEVTGWLEFGDGEGLEDKDPDDDVIPELRIASLVQHVDADLYSGYVIARSGGPATAATGGLADVRPAPQSQVGWSTALRNLFYAIEWWVFGLFALVIWWRWCRDTLNPPDEELPTEHPVRSSA